MAGKRGRLPLHRHSHSLKRGRWQIPLRTNSGDQTRHAQSYTHVLSRFAEHSGTETFLERLSAAETEQFIKAQELARTTRRTRYRIVGSFLRWAVSRDYIEPARPQITR